MKIVIAIVVLVSFSCSNPEVINQKTSPKFYSTFTNSLEDSIQSIELSYISWACACANWITEADMKKYQDTGKLSEHCIFIEPANDSLVIADTIGYTGDIIRLTGQFYQEKGYPENYEITEEHLDSARVFRYTKFEIVKSNYRDFLIDSSAQK